MDSVEPKIKSEKDPIVVGFKLGMDCAILQARSGRLRLAPMKWEKEKFPHTFPIRPWQITKLAWKSWWREKRRGFD